MNGKLLSKATTLAGFSAVLTLALFGVPGCEAQAPVPPAFQDLYDSLNADVGAFNTAINGIWSGTKYPVVYAGDLQDADGNAGPSLIGSGYYPSALLELRALKAAGVQGVMVQVEFPILYAPFYDFLATQPGFGGVTYQQFVDFYQQVAQNARAAGLKLIVENNVLLSNDASAGWAPAVGAYYATLDWDQFQQARAANALKIVQIMQPDYLVVLEQPDTQAQQTGQANVGTVSGAVSLVNTILGTLQPVRDSVKVGAGVESFLGSFQSYVQAFAGVNCSPSQPCVDPPGLDFIDMHIYPVNTLGAPRYQSFWQNALTIASIAASAGKPVAVTEAWLWKVRDSEWGVLTADEIRGRNPFSFWAPLDAYFVQTMESLANYAQMLFMAPEGPDYLFSYLTYDDSTAGLSPGQILSQESTAASKANQTAAYTSTGLSYYNSLVSPPDKVAPATPTILTATSGSTSTASLTWNSSADNVGTAGYYVLRDGVRVAMTGLTSFQDSGLAENTTYSYGIEAFDLGGNVSPPGIATIKTQNTTPPNPPANLAGTALSGQQINLTWTPSSGTVAVSSYLLFRGTAPANLVQIEQLSNSTASFTDSGLTPGTTYYFGMEATSKGLISPMSPLIAVTTLAPPSAPGNVAATPLSSTQIKLTWTPSAGGLPIANYYVYRGASASSLSQIGLCSNTSYTDKSLAAGTTYYYAVQAADTGKDLSRMSLTVAVSTPMPPGSPANVSARAVSNKQVNVTWTAAQSGGLPVSSYRVYRGSSPANLSQVALRTSISYTDTSVTARTTYYYGIQAVAEGGDLSPMSGIVAVTTPK